MAKRTTRNKLRHQAKMLISDADHMIERLIIIDTAIDDRSPKTTERIIGLVDMVKGMKEVFSQFHTEL